MNIKNRLAKMENQIIGNDSEFCACEKEVKFKIITSPEEKIESPNNCGICNKPMPEMMPITFNLNSDVQLTGKA